MRIQDWVGLGTLVIAVATGTFFIGELTTEVRELRSAVNDRDYIIAIQKARDAAIMAVLEAGNFATSETVLESHTWHQNDDNSPKTMLSTTEGICFLSRVSGDFNGPGEHLSVAPEQGQWVFRGRAGTARNYRINGTARCWRFPWVP